MTQRYSSCAAELAFLAMSAGVRFGVEEEETVQFDLEEKEALEVTDEAVDEVAKDTLEAVDSAIPVGPLWAAELSFL